jgi:hypothetical protein
MLLQGKITKHTLEKLSAWRDYGNNSGTCELSVSGYFVSVGQITQPLNLTFRQAVTKISVFRFLNGPWQL